jgi:hypothetical protein
MTKHILIFLSAVTLVACSYPETRNQDVISTDGEAHIAKCNYAAFASHRIMRLANGNYEIQECNVDGWERTPYTPTSLADAESYTQWVDRWRHEDYRPSQGQQVYP